MSAHSEPKPIQPLSVEWKVTPAGNRVTLASYRPEDISDIDPLVEGYDSPVWLWFGEDEEMVKLFWMGDRSFCFTQTEAMAEADHYL